MESLITQAPVSTSPRKICLAISPSAKNPGRKTLKLETQAQDVLNTLSRIRDPFDSSLCSSLLDRPQHLQILWLISFLFVSINRIYMSHPHPHSPRNPFYGQQFIPGIAFEYSKMSKSIVLARQKQKVLKESLSLPLIKPHKDISKAIEKTDKEGEFKKSTKI